MADPSNIPESTKIDRRKVGLESLWRQRLRQQKKPSPPSVRLIGVYRVERRLGQGGMGKVYLAHDDRLDRPVAIKQIRGDKKAARHRSRLQREARAIARLNHPAIAQVHDVVYAEDGYSIVMEYVEGQTITRLLTQGKMDGGLAINVAIQVAQGLAAAHHLEMVHRDLKADNVMVTPTGYAKILDFGLVKKLSPQESLESLTARGLLLGTVACMSPEQASGRPVDARSDLFSFGILLYEMFTGYSPFRQERWLESLESIKTGSQTPAHQVRPELPLELSNLIEWLLQKDPQRRPRKAQQAVDVLARIAATTRVGELPSPQAPWVDSSETPSEMVDSTGMIATAGPATAGPATAGLTTATAVSLNPIGWLRRIGVFNPSLMSMGFLVIVAVALMVWKMIASDPATYQVLVLDPVLNVSGNAADYEHVVSGVLASTVDALEEMELVAPVFPLASGDTNAGSPADRARRLGASEALASEIACRQATCVVQYRRINTADGSILFSGHFQVPIQSSEGKSLARAVSEQMDKLYPPDLLDFLP